MITAKMKILLHLVVWILIAKNADSHGIGFGIKKEIFFLNLEDGYFGCQVNESTDFLQLYELSRLCDGRNDCYKGSDELARELKCSNDCTKESGARCENGACLDSQCHCNDGYGGCSCEVPDENECKYRPCDVFAHCTNTLGSFHCSCFPGYAGDGFHCQDINECEDPSIAARCVANSECCNLPAHFLCKCLPGFQGDGEEECRDIDECLNPHACGINAVCQNTPGNYTCSCLQGYEGNPFQECVDIDECAYQGSCGIGAICSNTIGGYQCACPIGTTGDPVHGSCEDIDECVQNPCGNGAICTNTESSFHCACPPGFNGDPYIECAAVGCFDENDCASHQSCYENTCRNPCLVANPCSPNEECQVHDHHPACVKVCQCQKNSDCRGSANTICDGCNCVAQSEDRVVTTGCDHCPPGSACDQLTGACIKATGGKPKKPQPCEKDTDCLEIEACYNGMCEDLCGLGNICAPTAKCHVVKHRPVCTCPPGHQGNPAVKCFLPQPLTCLNNEDCGVTEACIGHTCQHPCDVHNPCAQNAVCVNTNHGCDCKCAEGFHGNGYVGCVPVMSHKSVCQYNEDCPPDKLCDRLNRVCINPCYDDPCGDNAECFPKNHGTDCRCLPGFSGNPYLFCTQVSGCQSDSECASNEACIHGSCGNPCNCGSNAICDVINHQPTCKCLPGYGGNAVLGCTGPLNPCDPNPCGINALCEIDAGGPICYCPKGMTGNPFKNCIPEGDECSPNPCGPHSGCRVVHNSPVCFCLPEYEGNPPAQQCSLPRHPCNPSPCGPNTQCSVLENGFAKCTCLPGYLESPNTIRGCVERRNPCYPNPCGVGALCDKDANPACYCPEPLVGNPYKVCAEPVKALCKPGPCGNNADCYVTGNAEQCYCRPGFIGDPYTSCQLEPKSPCFPSPCGPHALCTVTPQGHPMCLCPDGMAGDPFTGCGGPQCTVDDECPWELACIGYRCRDPCPGCCGFGASCRVEKHHPVCTCNHGLTGNPLIRCYEILSIDVPKNPCYPSPCGINTECRVSNGRPVCSCLPNYLGDPQTGCRPECIMNSDCGDDSACINQLCVNPCTANNVCGLGAICSCRDHTPSCSCPPNYVGDPLVQCIPRPVNEVYPNATLPCTPSPCGPDSMCMVFGQAAMCDPCGSPDAHWYPQCRPECIADSDCQFNHACINYKCIDPCPGSCGVNAQCSCMHHVPVCSCPHNMVGNPFEHCSPPLPDTGNKVDTCQQTRCGANAVCQEQYGSVNCVCLPNFYGNPYLGCRPECVINSDCGYNSACINNKCVDPCSGACGVHALCSCVNHVPICHCPELHTGDPFVSCYPINPATPPILGQPENPCDPSPCGPNSRCIVSHQGYATCSCLPGYRGVPPVCQPECLVSSECQPDKACINQKCVDPCPGTCGIGAHCLVINHNPICSCPPGQVGDPFVSCHLPPAFEEPKIPGNPCNPSPCGPNSICTVKQGHPVCSCSENYIGSPPYCRPECVMSQECPSHQACIQEKCQDPCSHNCGVNAECNVVNHTPFCTCLPGYQGDAFISCTKIPPTAPPELPRDPCELWPCADNAQCTNQNGVARCTCIPPYLGDPYSSGCRPECLMNADCAPNLACLSSHCRDPCPGVCGNNAQCSVVNHVAICSCLPGFMGDPFQSCRPKPQDPIKPVNPCEPSPCGANSLCRVQGETAVCSCIQGYIGAPPSCRPECVASSECSQNQACINQKCTDPCPGTCGLHANCHVINHNPICSCPPNTIGDPFVRCVQEEPKVPVVVENPCMPSPCGGNSECRVVEHRPVCSCLPGMLGAPPNCRPECLIHADCPTRLACISTKCKDPCVGSCGFNALCNVVNHQPICTCQPGYQGDPFSGCSQATERAPERFDPCFPSPCGPNAECQDRNGVGACTCLAGFQGDPYSGCRRECETNTDCVTALACIGFKCVDPCPGTCGAGAECTVANHIPICSCPPGFTGDPFFSCHQAAPIAPPPSQDPCVPSPCGPNSQCRTVNQQAVCSCMPNYIGHPPTCRPECVVSSECPLDRACINQRCADPCPNTCGLRAQCTTKNHNPICACPQGYTGDPFSQCTLIPAAPIPAPTPAPVSCVPSPCGPNSQCQIVGNQVACSCLPNYIGSPPMCRPECVLSSECPSQLACINQKCRDPCVGSCGANAVCRVVNHLPICSCDPGYSGDPFSYCTLEPTSTVPPPSDPCNPSPCGPNAQCQNGICECLPEYSGNPYEACRPECVLNSECPRDKTCIRNKCQDPCPGTCGQNAQCDVINHIPVCSCPQSYTGDPFSNCRPIPQALPSPVDPCNPSPCGPNSQCRAPNNVAVCSCLAGYIGSPPSCRPECVLSSECSQTQACVNNKCIDPCLGSCGLNARCQVINHSPICSCPPGQTGDPFRSCYPIPAAPIEPPVIRDPCQPSPCGPNSQCNGSPGGQPSCSCLPSYIGAPPNCRPECVINPDCQSTQACVNNKCVDPCPGTCGINAQCSVISHAVSCTCLPGFVGNAFVQCIEQKDEVINPCEPSPCGQNAICSQRNGAGSCTCIQDYTGNPYEGCRPECVLSSDCPTDKACVRNKCQDPCPGVCGQNAQCSVINHVPTCNCLPGYVGNPFTTCQLPAQEPLTEPTVRDPCNPSPCGPNSECRNNNGQAVCSCARDFMGSPPNCRPECVVNSECPTNRACYKQRCTDPCPGTCGLNARCQVINHNPICSCPSGQTGDPFNRCYPIPAAPPERPKPTNPCIPSPCGPNSECQVTAGNQAACSCRPNYIGVPPSCRPECVVNTDCPPTQACITEKCRDPCQGSCGLNAECRVQNHIPICSCSPGYTGDPFTQCSLIRAEAPPVVKDPCNPSPCGANAICNNGLCTCLPDYFGDPYSQCRPECTMNSDCPRNKACSNQHCIDPCPGTCGQGATCDVINHIPICSCPPPTTGDPFVACRQRAPEPPRDPCTPSPCGPNSLCRVSDGHAVCSCQPNFVGSPPQCRPECVVSAECPLTQACLNSKCRDPCPGTCGLNAKCSVVNHNPICSCPAGQTGDPFRQCFTLPVQQKPIVPVDPCRPSPCGPNSQCVVKGESPACSCLPNYIGMPPNCRPECTISPECPSTQACMNQKCADPCPGSCGANARCSVINHTPVCTCNGGYTGDPFTSCSLIQAEVPKPEPTNPCIPSPCGPNAVCRIEGTYGVCQCAPEYQGNPYEGCRPECVVSSDCPMSQACIRNKCADPCPGTCGLSAICSVSNHIPICSCPPGYTGDAFTSCRPVPREEPPANDPCRPSPCGPNTRCNAVNGVAICECLPEFQGSPSSSSGCRPECVISPDCPRNRACVNNKCVDPCPGVCGYMAVCHVVNHSPICSCPPGLQGDPFVECRQPPAPLPPSDPCNPSPCGQNGQCRAINGIATCIYPECVINQDCSRDKACYAQKCRDPCIDACGINAICQAVNHKAICSCPPGFIGEPRIQCSIQQQLPPKPECTSDSECSNVKACINQICADPCQAASTSVCAYNAECRVQMHRPICVCREGLTGNAQSQCFDIGCRADSQCPPTEACVNKQCVDPCRYTQCGIGAECRVEGGRARCICPQSFFGDPHVRCERPQCTTDSECPSFLACRNQRCQDPCSCAHGALCSVHNHLPSCQCPPGYIGNPHESCTLAPISGQCKMDADCPSKLACFSGDCRNPCVETRPCGANAECTVVDSLPLRTMSCQCLPGFVGDADVQCTQATPVEPGCKSDSECSLSETCVNRVCVNPCSISNPCAKTAICQPTNHKAACNCPPGLVGDPFVSCYRVPENKPECTTDSECPSQRACVNQRCQDPCAINNLCGTSAECTTIQHRPTCACPQGWAGNPQINCYKPECKVDADCVYDKACISGNCLSPCTSVSCGRGAECKVLSHTAQCVCPPGTQGDAHVACVSVGCQYNEDCSDIEACDRLNRVCRPVCEKDTCGRGARCHPRDHQPHCVCEPGTQGDPYVECIGYRLPAPSPECTQDSDCPSKLACINKQCQNPCSLPAVCSPDQECRVQDTLPLRTVLCQCPPDTIATGDGHCTPIRHPDVECRVDSDCSDPDRCVRGSCKEACRVDPCGLNAQCSSQRHQAICTCPPGFTGHPHIECTVEQRYPVPLPPMAECAHNDDCPGDKRCVNQLCVNPCSSGSPCAPGAFCRAHEHQPVCKCPPGFSGDPLTRCTPPADVLTGCLSNSECTPKESCVNRLCVSPCNCGPNAECKVQDHYPICYCKPGYSGDPQIGCVKTGCQSDNQCSDDKTCYNGECINPCILGDPCGANAECYGAGHRAQCRCYPGFSGSPLVRCERLECNVDADCPLDRTCLEHRCMNPCSDMANPPCASNAICYVRNHLAGCRCPEHLPLGNPLSFCYKAPPPKPGLPECEHDIECPSKLACIRNTCKNPCSELTPCNPTSMCSVFDTVPVRTMVCTCPEGWVPNEEGECKPVVLPTPPGCSSDSECSRNETCINRMCRNPCNCGPNAQCFVSNHRPICSCIVGYDGNPNIGCRAVGCRTDSECGSGRACINGNCINPCVVDDPCGANAECFAVGTRAECRCLSGYRGNPYERCLVVGCRSNSDCPSDRACINAQCINPCVYEHPCAPQAECQVQNHLALCRCPPNFEGNPYTSCRPKIQPECHVDGDCPALLACFNSRCKDPCGVLEPCQRPASCLVVSTLPVRTMICECPPGYISSGSGTCKATPPVSKIGECVSDSDCPSDRSCINAICKNPCNCGPNAECRVRDHKPVCSCLLGFEGNPDIECIKAGCRHDTDCSGQHACLNRECVPVCSPDGSSCGTGALCYGSNHRAICNCPPGLTGDPQVGCILVECETNSDCPNDKACINTKCVSPCEESNPCISPAECTVYNHVVDCSCPPGYIGDIGTGCTPIEKKCEGDYDCPSQTACINAECVNPCNATAPCGLNTICHVYDTYPVRTMVCECIPGYHGNAAVQCDKVSECPPDKGFVRDKNGNCVCPPGTGLNNLDECIRCLPELGFKIDERGYCICDLEKGMSINDRGDCVCPTDHGYILDINGFCVRKIVPECESDDDCADHLYCNLESKTCQDPCAAHVCVPNAFCNASHHIAICQCISGYIGDPNIACKPPSNMRTDFPRPDMAVSCLSDGVQVEIHIEEKGFNGVLYVKGHSKDEKCRRVVSLPNDSQPKLEVFKVNFGTCGLIHVNGQASFVLVIQKHPMLVTFKTQAYHIKCVYTTGEQNVTLGFNVSMLTTAGTIANTGPPPTCLMRIVTHTGQEISSAEIGDNLMLQVDVQPSSIYGGFARSCVAKTMEDSVENEYIVTDENGCATEPNIFGEWDYNPETQSLLANFNAFKFPSSDNIRFQCNIRVCFGKCQPVNCRGYNAFGRKRREISEKNNTGVDVSESVSEGQLREEITIQSNAILTLERREERFVDPTEAPLVPQIDDICVSMIGFIIALVITALLALVAVAVAVSCWLIAYRRRPKSGGPLPHPPEFPNPLFTTPEPLTEPSPDYLS